MHAHHKSCLVILGTCYFPLSTKTTALNCTSREQPPLTVPCCAPTPTALCSPLPISTLRRSSSHTPARAMLPQNSCCAAQGREHCHATAVPRSLFLILSESACSCVFPPVYSSCCLLSCKRFGKVPFFFLNTLFDLTTGQVPSPSPRLVKAVAIQNCAGMTNTQLSSSLQLFKTRLLARTQSRKCKT